MSLLSSADGATGAASSSRRRDAARRFGIQAGMPVVARRRAAAPRRRSSRAPFADYRRTSRARCGRAGARFLRWWPWRARRGLLDFAGTERLYPVSLFPVAEQLRDEVKSESGLDCSVGIGPNRMVAKLASDAAKPRGLMEAPRGLGGGVSRRDSRSARFRASAPTTGGPLGRAGTGRRLARCREWTSRRSSG